MPSIKDFLDLMGASWPIALGILLASVGVLTADYNELRYMATLPAWAPGVAFIFTVISASVLAVSLIRVVANLVRSPFARRRRETYIAEQIAGLEGISQREKLLLLWAVANETQVFIGDYFDGSVKALLARGYVTIPPGNHHTNRTPFFIPDHIWDALKTELAGENLSQLVGARPFD